ncbi:hypothetical protein PM3016_3690 [Paenibacillus mucilaginosus 3016]|uniref:Peptidase G2 IMC autoproteolytic cleavage domain-containing protein n=2 Tax=Paenibacillus mucilaginosus TaxID=61624 RepID=H6NNY3_9BACL|nr:peptidase G2 autoproteolytic cleavage domain-containing protein [Paenibacillus mucilaginosus]AFC30509.1 hypothetical protein PM3016_3690 [Paenibacillus mucilaginosus 3016]WFA19138.1 hypothetical protein ERY13_18635 [Paenibacillus mucilaginosus]
MADSCSRKATGACSEAEGYTTTASGQASHAEGWMTAASGVASHAEGVSTVAEANASHSEGNGSRTTGFAAHAEGNGSIAEGFAAHSEGYFSRAQGKYSHAEGDVNTAVGYASHAEGSGCNAEGAASHAEGFLTIARGQHSHTEGAGTLAEGFAAHAEGEVTDATERGAHAEGIFSKARALAAHAEGNWTRAFGSCSHTEGSFTTTEGACAHAEGLQTKASGNYAHAEGANTTADADYSHAGGRNTDTGGFEGAFIIGRYASAQYPYSFHLGNGMENGPSRNVVILDQEGNVRIEGTVISGSADYAVMFETTDGMPIEPGYWVTLEGEKIRKADAGDRYVLGIVSSSPAVLGDAADLRWKNMFLTDVWGRVLYEESDVPEQRDPEGNVVIPAGRRIHPVLHPSYDPRQVYIPRMQRPEWAAVGLLGKLLARDDGTCVPGGYCRPGERGVATASEKGYRVLKRVGPNQILVLVR